MYRGLTLTALTAFLFSGLLSLAWQTYSDFKSMEVDSRRNWFMYGVLLAIVLLTSIPFWLYLLFVVATLVFTKRIEKMFCDGDLEALRWTIPGFFILNLSYGVIFMCAFSFFTLVYLLARNRLGIRVNTAAYSVILGAFLVTAAFALKI